MTRTILLLIVAVLGSAFWLVQLQYRSRVLYSAIHQAEKEARQLEVKRERLDAELRTASAVGRVERIARERMQMRSPTPAITQYVSGTDGRAAEARR